MVSGFVKLRGQYVAVKPEQRAFAIQAAANAGASGNVASGLHLLNDHTAERPPVGKEVNRPTQHILQVLLAAFDLKFKSLSRKAGEIRAGCDRDRRLSIPESASSLSCAFVILRWGETVAISPESHENGGGYPKTTQYRVRILIIIQPAIVKSDGSRSPLQQAFFTARDILRAVKQIRIRDRSIFVTDLQNRSGQWCKTSLRVHSARVVAVCFPAGKHGDASESSWRSVIGHDLSPDNAGDTQEWC